MDFVIVVVFTVMDIRKDKEKKKEEKIYGFLSFPLGKNGWIVYGKVLKTVKNDIFLICQEIVSDHKFNCHQQSKERCRQGFWCESLKFYQKNKIEQQNKYEHLCSKDDAYS